MKRWVGYERGINLGGWISQCDYRKEYMDTFIKEEDIEIIARSKIDHVRLPIDYEVISEIEVKKDIEGLKYIDNCIKWCQNRDLRVVLDLHKAPGFFFTEGEKNTLFEDETMQERFLNIWDVLAERYSQYADNLAFELLNEIVEKDSSRWNKLASKAIAVIRKHSKKIKIIVGGIQWNSVHTLDQLDIPIDENIVYNFHFYEPFLFTHQSASWMALMPKCDREYPGDIEEYRETSRKINAYGSGLNNIGIDKLGTDYMKSLINEAVRVAEEKSVYLYCGEYGVISHAPAESIIRWYEDIHKVFEEMQIAHAAWTYKSMDFGIWEGYPEQIREQVIANL